MHYEHISLLTSIKRQFTSALSTGLSYKHCSNCKLMALKIVNAVACTVNMITIITDNFINTLPS
jgi:hypothetical protein